MLNIVVDRGLSLWTCGHRVKGPIIPIPYRFMANPLSVDYTRVLDNVSMANMLNKLAYKVQRVSNNFVFNLHGSHNSMAFFWCIGTYSCGVIYANSHMCP